jgi:hypothetical protein
MCANLGTNVLDYGQKYAADQMRTSWENLAQYVGTNYGQDISNKMQNKITVILVEPVHTDDVLLKHSLRENMIRNGQMNIQRARKAEETILEAAVQGGLDMEAPMKLALLQNEIAQGEFSANVEVPIVLNDTQCQYDQASRPSILFDSRTVHSATPRQDETRHGLGDIGTN